MSICQKIVALLKGVASSKVSVRPMHVRYLFKKKTRLFRGSYKPILQESQVSMYTVLFFSFYHEQILMQLSLNFKGQLIPL